MTETAKIIDGPGKQNKIDKEMAELEFKRFIQRWDIDDDFDSMSPESFEAFEDQKRIIIRAVMNGRAIFNDDGTIDYEMNTPAFQTEKYTIRMPKGRDMNKMDDYKERQQQHKINAVIASVTGLSPKIISEMEMIDLRFAQSVLTLFLAS